MQNHRFSGAILHSFCIFKGKSQRKLAFLLQFAVTGGGAEHDELGVIAVRFIIFSIKFIIVNT